MRKFLSALLLVALLCGSALAGTSPDYSKASSWGTSPGNHKGRRHVLYYRD